MILCPVHGKVIKPCAKCKEEQSKTPSQRTYDKWGRNRETDKFYHSKAWKDARAKQLKSEPLCSRCGRPAKIVDHIKEIQDGGDRLSEDNLQSMCQKCHNIKTAEEKKKREGGQNRSKSNPNTPTPTSQLFQTPNSKGGAVEKKKIEWELIKKEYENTTHSLRTLASTYGIHHTTISKKIKKEGWTRIAQSSEVSTTVTMLAYGEAYSDDKIVEQLRAEVKGKWGLLFFDITTAEMKKKYWTYDYFALLLASNFYQDAMDARIHSPENHLAFTDKGDSYVSAEYNLHISATANFMKITKELGLNPMSRAKASVKVVEKIKQNSLFDAKPTRNRRIEI